jgi:hypothetical protein
MIFNFGYRYYVCDLSRRASYENNKPQSVAVLGTNVCKKAGAPIPWTISLLLRIINS